MARGKEMNAFAKSSIALRKMWKESDLKIGGQDLIASIRQRILLGQSDLWFFEVSDSRILLPNHKPSKSNGLRWS